MTADGIETLAMQGMAMPVGLDLADQLLFQSFRHLYAAAALGKVSAEDGSREKRALLAEHQRAKETLRQAEENVRRNARMWKDIEAAANRFGTERTVESAEAFHRAVYGVGLLAGTRKDVEHDRKK